jgi:small-conductance mechanosensitive channel
LFFISFAGTSRIDRLNALIPELLGRIMEFLSSTHVLWQLLIISLTLLLSWSLARILKPRLERRIRAMRNPDPRLLRVLSLLLRRMEWIFFVLFTSMAFLMVRAVGWSGSDYLIRVSLILALAWLAIALLSRLIRNRALSGIVAVGVWVFVALVVLNIDDDMAQLLDAIGFNLGGFRLSALLVLKMIVVTGGLIWLSVVIGNFLENRVDALEDLSPSLRVLIGKIVKISLITAAVLVSISSLGIDLTIFAVFSGAIGVGLGFGLQKVVSNFISGIIILMDRSIKPGDTIKLGETFGWIRELRARFVSVVTRDGHEYLIPNEDFITTQVVNWSFSDQLVRLDVEFGVSYDSDPHEVIRLAVAAAKNCPRVRDRPDPVCWLTAFGDSSLDFILRFWITDPQQGLTNVRGKVLLAVWDTFKEHDIAIPYPHREIIMKSGAPPADTERGS